MDCRNALERLEAARPDSDDLLDPELAPAAAHLREHPECARRFQARQDLDRLIGEAMRDVTVPTDLKRRLLESLAPAADAERPRRTSGGRGRLWGAAIAAAACLVAAVAFWLFRGPSESPLTVNELRESAVATYDGFDRLPAYEGPFPALLPDFWRPEVVRGLEDVRSVPVGTSRFGAAAYRYELAGPAGQPLRGVLVVVPADAVGELPPSKYLPEETVRYHGRYTTVAWTEGERVYVCLIDGPGDALQRLSDALSFGPAA